jgi:methyl-accepting chemotaxis protein
MADLESALKKLDRLTQEEARMALSEVLRITHSVRDEVKVVDGKMECVRDEVKDTGDKVADMGDKVADMGDNVADMGDKVADMGDNVEEICNKVEDIGDKVEDIGDEVEDIGDKVDDMGDKMVHVDENIQVVINGARGMSTQLQISDNTYACRRHASKSSHAGSKIDRSTDGTRRGRNQMFVICLLCRCSLLALKLTRREPAKAAITSVALSCGSLHKSQHCAKGSTQGNSDLVLSRQYIH